MHCPLLVYISLNYFCIFISDLLASRSVAEMDRAAKKSHRVRMARRLKHVSRNLTPISKRKYNIVMGREKREIS